MTVEYEFVPLIARRDIDGREWTFAKGRHLVGKRGAGGTWTVWPRRDPLAYLIGVPDELVREIVPFTPCPNCGKRYASVAGAVYCCGYKLPKTN
jgi:hypothetical protein